MKQKFFILILICLAGNTKLDAQNITVIDSCYLSYFVEHSENQNFLHLMEIQNVSKKFKIKKIESNKSSQTITYTSDYGDFEINYDNFNLWVKFKNIKAELNFNYKFSYELIGLKKYKSMISFILKTKFTDQCKPYISVDFVYDEKQKIKSFQFKQFDFVDGK